uniref:Bifunctional inhibitor/plant lipid transfer protein/seed storage helical domain-containing protein n=1 Tax=Aegilops tauschii subsp. strangulata TaxID=200361 RepID=A0A453DA07_AEGTS|nr:uncharacterized protein LOC109764317 [Aegilops tauschii subsp. strangulata]
MAAAMLPRLAAMAALVALMCAVAVAQKVPAIGGAPVCDGVDQNVVNACFKSFGEGNKDATADRIISGKVSQVQVDCCVAFGGHSCLCKMKKAWKAPAQSKSAQVQCVKQKAC